MLAARARYAASSTQRKKDLTMENTFGSNWRLVTLPLIFTAIVIGSALGFAFS